VQFQLGPAVPFCIFQRLCFAALGIVFTAWRAARAPGTGAGCCAGRAGVGMASALLGATEPAGLPSCGPGLNFIVEQHSWLGAAKQVLLPRDCSNIDWTFPGTTCRCGRCAVRGARAVGAAPAGSAAAIGSTGNSCDAAGWAR
jgi:disulfide bond formation protein DsbB